MPGAPCEGTPHRHGDTGQGVRGGGGPRGGRVPRAAGRPVFDMNYPPAEPPLWGMLKERSHTQWPSKRTHRLTRLCTTTQLCVRPDNHNS